MSKSDRAKKRQTRKHYAKPSAPRVIVSTEATNDNASTDEDKRAMRAEDARVKARVGGRVNRDPRTGKTTSREIDDIVALLARTKDARGNTLIGVDEVGAVRRFETLIEKSAAPQGSALSSMERVGGQSASDPVLGQVIRRHDAALELARLQAGLGPMTWRLLRELCDGNLGLDVWHGVVTRLTGEAASKAHGAIVRMAFRELSEVMRRPANDDRPDVAKPLAG